ncbi:MAG: glucose-1-phosphate adenylyltransferase subunit GlgD [Lachnospiraceae bacterium]|nr:glucose-1-phosphate adenylyltransferase subunit GlgD [Lachnospiraceae bacterium]
MIKSSTNVIGIIFPNSYDALVPELVSVRLMASIPFASRYRIIDFILSSMTHSGIDNISVIVNQNYHSLMDHLGSGREWDLVRKNGGLHIFPPFAEKKVDGPYVGRAGALANLLNFLKNQKEKYVVMSDTNVVVNCDFNAMLQAHADNKADITIAYNEQELPKELLDYQTSDRVFYYTFDVEQGRIRKVYINPKTDGVQNTSMNIFVMERELLIDLVSNAYMQGRSFFMRDVIMPQLGKLNVQAYKYTGYVARISGMKSYFEENMKLLDDYNLDALFSGAPIYTKIRGDNPTHYKDGAKVQNAMMADGCVIEGEVENSVIFRGVKVGKGAKIKNCILMQDTVVEAGANVEYLITDKNVTITAGKEMKGTDTFPVYIEKFKTV